MIFDNASSPSGNQRIRITRSIELPNLKAVSRFKRSPELGPQILFFSGGSALCNLSQQLIEYTHNSIHLITPFDSGGSSAVLRKAFSMPAIGDIRSRLMALADRGYTGCPHIFNLFSHRFAKMESNAALKRTLASMADGKHEFVAAIADPMNKIIRQYLNDFQKKIPANFDLRGANIGNLILASGYLFNRRQLDSIIYIFSRLVNSLGVVCPVIDKNLHLAVELADGSRFIGEHRITGKETKPISSPIRKMIISTTIEDWQPISPPINDRIQKLVQSADLICYPMGSFYTSVLANLLPKKMGQAICKADCPKVFVPSMGYDPELIGLNLTDQMEQLLKFLQNDAPNATTNQLLQFVIVDREKGSYQGEIDEKWLDQRGITLIDTNLVSTASAPYIAPEKLIPMLLSLA